MPRIVLTLTSPLFDEDQEVSIRENLPARTLLAEIRKEYSLPDGNYNLKLKSNSRTVDLDKTLEQSGVNTGAVVIFNIERRAAPAAVRQPLVVDIDARREITGPMRAFLKEESSGQIFEIRWHPAVIGRPDSGNPASAESLAVNLGDVEAAKTVSRNHARILEQNGQYYLESVAENNPTYLNGGTVRHGERRLLEVSDEITVGKVVLIYGLKPAQAESTDVQRMNRGQ